jgi:replicative DNA helicase
MISADISPEELLARINRALPESLEAEKGVISCLLQSPQERLADARIQIPPEAFYREHLRTIYLLMLEMADKSLPVGPVEITHLLRERDLIDKVGGAAEISDLFGFTPIPAHWPFYVRILREKLTLRQLIAANLRSAWMAFEHGKEQDDVDVAQVVSVSQEMVFAVNSEAATGDGGVEYRECIMDVLESVERQLNHPAEIPAERVPFGFTDLDRRVWGFVRGQLVILAARPSMGKSALAKDIYGNVGRGEGHYDEWNGQRWPHRVAKRVCVFNLEMTNEQSVTRDLVGGAGLDLQATRYGLRVDREWHEKLGARTRDLARSNIRIYDRPGMSIQRMRAICRQQKRKHGLDLVVVDYLQLMSSETKRAQQNREREIAEISAGLKEMAKELDCVVLALAQLNRSAEERKEKKPTLADLRESGTIEQDADVVMMLMRPHYYDENQPKDLALLILAKGRDVGIGEIELSFDGPRTTFSSGTRKLLSNNEEQRERRYQSKPQPCKQSRRQQAILDEDFPD